MPSAPRSTARLVLLRLLAAAVTVTTATATASPASAAPVPPTPTGLPAGVEALASYVGANSCDAAAKPGATALGALLTSTYAGTSFHVARPCGSDSLATTEHYDGRAVDWMVNARNTTQRGYASAALSWMLAKDARGNAHAVARRLGVMYLIWNNKTWSAYRPEEGWREYSGCLSTAKAGTAYDTACHRNHVHISLSWAGAMKRSSYWSKAVAQPEYGPCRTAYLNWAPPRTSANLTRCTTPAKVVAKPGASSLGRQLVGYSGMYLRQGSTGPAVSALQRALGLSASGSFSSTTRTSLLSWQGRQGLRGTGVTDALTWYRMTRPHSAEPASKGLDGDARPDLLTRRTNGDLALHTSAADPGGRVVGLGWDVFDTVIGAADFSGDGSSDVLARKPDGTLWLYAGTGAGTFRAGVRIGLGWQVFTEILSPGDFTGDGAADVLARKPDGTLWLYAGNGRGGWAAAGRRVGLGWQMFAHVVPGGDRTGDGRSDVLALRPDGSLLVYAGNGRGGWAAAGQTVARGWDGSAPVVGVR
jgi:hypothetical protein